MPVRLAADLGLFFFNLLEPHERVRARRGIAYGSLPRQTLDVYAPRRAAAAPMIVFLHGGGWRMGGRRGYAFVGRSLARAGFVAIVASYRLYPAVSFPAFVEDAAAAVAWARAHARRFGGDPGRLYAMGHSAGAHSAALLAVDPRFLAPHGLVSRDLAGVIGLAGPYAFRPEDDPHFRSIFAGAGDAGRPARLVHRAPPPLLLMHGAADTSVSIANTRRLAAAAHCAGGRVVVHEYEGVGHAGVLLALSHRFRHRAPVLDDIVAFASEPAAEAAHRLAPAR